MGGHNKMAPVGCGAASSAATAAADDGGGGGSGGHQEPLARLGPVAGGKTDGGHNEPNSIVAAEYDVEHLATFSIASSHETQAPNGDASDGISGCDSSVPNSNNLNNRQRQQQRQRRQQHQQRQHQSVAEPRVALQRLFELEKLSGIWTQRMQIELRNDLMLILDCETNSIVERFHRDRVSQPEAFNQYNGIYNNIIVFRIDQQLGRNSKSSQAIVDETTTPRATGRHRDDEPPTPPPIATECDNAATSTTNAGELHIFQCVSHKAKQLVADILAWKARDMMVVQATTSEKLHRDMSKVASRPTSSGAASEMNPKKTTATSVFNSSDKDVTSQQVDRNTKQVDSRGEPARPITNTNANVNMTASKTPTTTTNASNDSTAVTSTTTTPASDGVGAKPVVVTVASSSTNSENVPIVNVNVKETVQVFNQIAALRERGSGTGASNNQPSSTSTAAAASNSTTRPISSDVSVASSGQGEGANLSSSALSPDGQFYKQRSIRATLAPKLAAEDHQQSSSTNSAASSMASSAAHANHSSGKPALASSSSISSSCSNSAASSSSHLDCHIAAHDARPTSKVPAPPLPPPSGHRKIGPHHDSDAIEHTSGSAYAQSNPSSSSLRNQHETRSPRDSNGQTKTLSNSITASTTPGSRPSNGHNGHSLHNRHNVRHQQQKHHSSSDSSQRSHASPSSQQSLSQQLEQHAYAAMHELQAKRRQTKKSTQQPAGMGGQPSSGHHKSQALNGSSAQQHQKQQPAQTLSASDLAVLNSRARGPNAEDFFEILSKFKLAFNLLAKLKGCIHEPNAPELVHFLFTPLAIIIESARNVVPPVDPTVVAIPYLNKDALELLSNCCTSKESDLWLSLGPNWTQTIEPSLLKASRLPSSFQPIFSDGWAPVISELELIGLVAPPSLQKADHDHYRSARAICAPALNQDLDDSGPITSNCKGELHRRHQMSLSQTSNGEPSLKPAGANGAHSMGAIVRRQNHKRRGSPAAAQLQHNSQNLSGGHRSPHGADLFPQDLPESALEQTGPYRVPKQLGNHNEMRHSMPKGDKQQLPSSRRKSDHPSGVYGAGRFSPPAAGGYLPGHMSRAMSGYSPSYSANPSDDYTELQDDHLAGPSLLRRNLNAVQYHDYDSTAEALPIGSPYGIHPERYLAVNGPPPREYHPDINHQFVDEAEREAMLLDLGPTQTEWFYELSSRGALIVRVLFTRDANNDKELTVKRGEILEILDDSRKWWKARNIDLQVAYVPHTIVAIMDHYQTLDELLTNSPADLMIPSGDEHALMSPQSYARREMHFDGHIDGYNPNFGLRDDRRNSKTARGAFRYF